jgi:hypothetical protein
MMTPDRHENGAERLDDGDHHALAFEAAGDIRRVIEGHYPLVAIDGHAASRALMPLTDNIAALLSGFLLHSGEAAFREVLGMAFARIERVARTLAADAQERPN